MGVRTVFERGSNGGFERYSNGIRTRVRTGFERVCPRTPHTPLASCARFGGAGATHRNSQVPASKDPLKTQNGSFFLQGPTLKGDRHEPAKTAHRLLAIDIGRTGALALFVDQKLADIADMPTLDDGPAGRPTINGPLLAAVLRRWNPEQAVCELVAARPGEAPSGAFAFGRSRGVIEGVLAAHGIPIRFVTPSWWKRRTGIPPGDGMKDMARSVAISRWPARAEQFARKKDHDRAEAALIGLAYLEDSR